MKIAHLRYHLPSGLIAFSVIGFLLELLYHSFPGGSVLESKFRDNPAELVWLCVLYSMQRYTEPQNKFAKTIYDTSMYDAQDDYPFGAIGKEIRHPATQTKSNVFFK